MSENEQLLDERNSVVDLYHHPFRAMYGYEEWAKQAGLMASTILGEFHEAERVGLLSEEDVKAYNANAFLVIRNFNEFGYNSRVAETAVLTPTDVWSLMSKSIGYEEIDELRERPAVIRAALVKLAKDAFVWGRTGDPAFKAKFNDEVHAAEIPEPKDIFFPEDIEIFEAAISNEVTRVTLDTLKKQGGILGRLALRMKHRSGTPLDVLTPRKKRITSEQFLQLRVGTAARTVASSLLKGSLQETQED